jgi:hypothetical protein
MSELAQDWVEGISAAVLVVVAFLHIRRISNRPTTPPAVRTLARGFMAFALFLLGATILVMVVAFIMELLEHVRV